jgi:putative Holliday junction resolvase
VRCLALDVGERRIGLALGQSLAHPLTTLRRRSKVQDFQTIAGLIREHQIEKIVAGLPLNMDGSLGFQAQRVQRYVERLCDALAAMGIQVEVAFWDERLSTVEASDLLRTGDRSHSGTHDNVDAVAAAVILQGYLDENYDVEN